MEVKAFAKVNLALDITGKREDGYHDLDMIMAPVNVFDTLSVDRLDRQAVEDEIFCTNETLPENNTLVKTLHAMRAQGGLEGYYRVVLTKGIPSQAGMGGASADAAALIHALCEIESLPLDMEEKIQIGRSVGSDVPYCLVGGYARVRGTGEKVQPVFTDWKIPVLLVKPEGGLSTPESFARYDEMENRSYDIDIVEDALRKQDIGLLYQTMANALEPQAFEAIPLLETVREDLADQGLVRVMMTGSGSCMMGFCVDEELLDQAEQVLKDRYPFVRKAWIG